MFECFTPKFVKKYANLNDHILRAFEEYSQDVCEVSFSTGEYAFHIDEGELKKRRGDG